MSTTDTSSAERSTWADALRLIATWMVIAVHCTDPFNVSPEARLNPDYNFWGALYGSALRPCVPLFVILTGYLLVPIREESAVFYRKRLGRILVPFGMWSVIYNLFPWLLGMFGWGPEAVKSLFAYAPAQPDMSLVAGLKAVLLSPLQFGVYTIHLWYLYMLVGLYLFMPFFSAWLAGAQAAEQKVFWSLWLASLFLPYLYEFFSPHILGLSAWNSFGTLYYFSGFVGYLYLGYQIRQGAFIVRRPLHVLGLMALWLAGFGITYLGFRHMTQNPASTEAQMELFFLYCSPQVVAMTLPLVLAIQSIPLRSPSLVRLLAHFSRCGLGIYLAHYAVVGVVYTWVASWGLPLAARIPVSASLVLGASWALVAALIQLWPRGSRYLFG